MRKIAAYILFILLLTSCMDDSYRGSADNPLSGLESCPVRVSVGSYTGTKGSGSIDDESALWGDHSFYVYAFRKGAASFAAKSTDGGNIPDCIVDASGDGVRNAGRKAHFSAVDRFAPWDGNGTDLYYPGGDPAGLEPYDFYAYYTDDIAVRDSDIERAADYVRMPVTIDGSNDLMTSKAEYTGGADLQPEDRYNIPNHTFSAFAANRNVHPEFYFKHHLSKIRFEGYCGTEFRGDVYIDTVMIETPVNGVFTVLHKDPSKVGVDFSADKSKKILFLTEPDGKTQLIEKKYKLVWNDGDKYLPVFERQKTVVGGCFLVPPMVEEYRCHIVINAFFTETGPVATARTVTIRSSDGLFLPGKQYVVRIGVMAMDHMIFDVELKPWEYGGNATIDGEEFGQ